MRKGGTRACNSDYGALGSIQRLTVRLGAYYSDYGALGSIFFPSYHFLKVTVKYFRSTFWVKSLGENDAFALPSMTIAYRLS